MKNKRRLASGRRRQVFKVQKTSDVPEISFQSYIKHLIETGVLKEGERFDAEAYKEHFIGKWVSNG